MLCQTCPSTTQKPGLDALFQIAGSRCLETRQLQALHFLDSQYTDRLACTASRHSRQDFLLLDPGENKKKWNAVSLSLVLNFVPESRDRGEQSDQCRFDLLNNMKGVCCTWLILSSRILDTSFLQFVLFYFFCPILTLTASLALCRQFTLYDI